MSNGTPPPPPPQTPPPQTPPPRTPPPRTPSSPPNPYTPQGSGSSDSGMPMWAKIGIGCGCLALLLGLVVLGGLFWGAKKVVDVAKDFESNPAKAVETLINLNPDLEVVENDPDSGRITIRDVKSGQESTFDYSDVKSGRISFESDEGSFNIDASQEGKVTVDTPDGQTATFGMDTGDTPSWVPLYSNLDGEDHTGGMTMVEGDQVTGLRAGKTADALDDVDAWYTKKLEEGGFECERNTMSFNEANTVIFNCKKEGVDSLSIAVAREGSQDHTTVTLNFTGLKG